MAILILSAPRMTMGAEQAVTGAREHHLAPSPKEKKAPASGTSSTTTEGRANVIASSPQGPVLPAAPGPAPPAAAVERTCKYLDPDCDCTMAGCFQTEPSESAREDAEVKKPARDPRSEAVNADPGSPLMPLIGIVMLVAFAAACCGLGVLIYRESGFWKRGRRMPSTITINQRIHERLRRLEVDNQHLRELLEALQHRIDALQYVINQLQSRETGAAADYHRLSQPLQRAAPPLAIGADAVGALVSAYNESLHTQPGVRAFLQVRPVFGLARSNGRDVLRHIDGDLQQCDFWGMRDERRGEVLVLPGRKHYMNASALARDDGRVGREALGPVFEITWGSVFSLVQAARGRETEAGVEILQPGRLEVPR
jgi:hypothetical protein